MANYKAQQIYFSLKKIGLKKNDLIFCHTNLGFFGEMKNIRDKNALCKIFYNQIFRIIGKNGTLIVPTFSYSFFNKKNFDQNKTPGFIMGIFSEWVRNNKNSSRSADPNFSISAVGKLKKNFTQDLDDKKNTYSKKSFFGKFHTYNGKILNFNFPGTTIIHYYEKMLNVPYRFDKKFVGMVNKKKETWTVFSKYLSAKKNIHNPHKLMEILRKKKKNRFCNLGKGEIFIISSKELFSFIKKEYSKNKELLIN